MDLTNIHFNQPSPSLSGVMSFEDRMSDFIVGDAVEFFLNNVAIDIPSTPVGSFDLSKLDVMEYCELRAIIMKAMNECKWLSLPERLKTLCIVMDRLAIPQRYKTVFVRDVADYFSNDITVHAEACARCLHICPQYFPMLVEALLDRRTRGRFYERPASQILPRFFESSPGFHFQATGPIRDFDSGSRVWMLGKGFCGFVKPKFRKRYLQPDVRRAQLPFHDTMVGKYLFDEPVFDRVINHVDAPWYLKMDSYQAFCELQRLTGCRYSRPRDGFHNFRFNAFGLGLGDVAKEVKNTTDRVMDKADGLVEQLTAVMEVLKTIGITANNNFAIASDNLVAMHGTAVEVSSLAATGISVGLSVYEFTVCVAVAVSVLWLANKYGLLDNIVGLATSVIAAIGLGAMASPAIRFIIGLLKTQWADTIGFKLQSGGLIGSFASHIVKEAICDYIPMPGTIRRFIQDMPRSGIAALSLKDMLYETLLELQDIINLVRSMFGLKAMNLLKSEALLVDQWIRDVEVFTDSVEARSSGVSMTDTSTVRDLIRRYDSVRKIVSVKSRFYSIISQKYGALLNYSAIIGALAGARERTEPVFILVYGLAGCGKSSVFQHLVRYLIAKFYEGTGFINTIEELDRQIYQTCTDKFWNGWDNQAAVICDDIFQVPADSQKAGDAESDAMKVVRMINCVQYPLLSASVEDKGKKYFNAKLVIGSTNRAQLGDEVYKTISDSGALLRRIHFGIRLQPGPNYCKEGLLPTHANALDLNKVVAQMKLNGGRVTDDMFTIHHHNFFGNTEKYKPLLYSELLDQAHKLMVSNEKTRNELTACIEEGLRADFGFQASGVVSYEINGIVDEQDQSRTWFDWVCGFMRKRDPILQMEDMLAPEDEFQATSEDSFPVKDSYYDYVMSTSKDCFTFCTSNYWMRLASLAGFVTIVIGVFKMCSLNSKVDENPIVEQFRTFVSERGLTADTITNSNLRSFLSLVKPKQELQATEQSRAVMDKVLSNRCSVHIVGPDVNVLQVTATFITSDVMMISGHFEYILDGSDDDVSVEIRSLGTGEVIIRASKTVFLRKLRASVCVEGTEVKLFRCGVARSFCDIRKFFVCASDVRAGIIEGVSMLGHYNNKHGPEHRVFGVDRVTYRGDTHSPKAFGSYNPSCVGHFVYDIGAKPGDCGSLLFQSAVDPLQCRKIYGVHYGAHGCVNYGCLVTKERLEKAMSVLDVIPTPNLDSVLSGEFAFNAGLPSLVALGRVSRGANVPSRSTLFKSRWGLLEPFGPHHKVPAILRPHGLLNPMKLALSKVATPVTLLDSSRSRRVCFAVMSRHWDATVAYRRSILSYKAAVQGDPSVGMSGIPRGTSSGYPLNIQGHKDKTTIFGPDGDYVFNTAGSQLVEGSVMRVEQVLARGERPSGDDAFVWMDFLKDELLPEAKVEAGKARMISCAPLVYTILFRMYFGDFMQSVQSSRVYNGIAIGVNPYKEWGTIASHLTSVGCTLLAGDFSGFDASEVPDIHSAILDYVNAWYGDGEREQRIRRVLWQEVTNSLHIGGWGNYRDILYFWTKSLPSGHPATGIINSIYNLILFGLCFEDLVGDVSLFWDHIRPIVLGDDNVISVAPSLIPLYNQFTISECMCKYGVVYTDDMKGVSAFASRPIDKVSFLKRRFVYDSGASCWLCPLEWDSVRFMGYYCRNRATEVADLSMSVSGALREASLHGVEKFSAYVEAVRRGFPLAGLGVPADFVMSYNDVRTQVLYDPKVFPWEYDTIYKL